MTVEVPHPGPARILEQLDEEKRRLGIVAAEPQVLVESPRLLPIEIDVEKLAGFQRLGHGVGEVEAGHALVRHLRIHTHHLGMLESIDESEHVSGGREEHVAARLVGLRLEREPEVVALRAHVLAQEVDGVAVPAERGAGILGGVRLHAFSPAPADVHRRPQLHRQVDGPHGLLQGVRPHPRVVTGKGAVAEDGIREKVGGRHRHAHPRVGERLLELAHDAIPLRGRGVPGHQVVVVQVDAIGAELRQLTNDANGGKRGPYGVPERIASRVADGPEPEREVVLGPGRIGVLCDSRTHVVGSPNGRLD